MKIKIVENFNDMFITTKYIDSSYDDEDLAKFEERQLNDAIWWGNFYSKLSDDEIREIRDIQLKQLNEKEEREKRRESNKNKLNKYT